MTALALPVSAGSVVCAYRETLRMDALAVSKFSIDSFTDRSEPFAGRTSSLQVGRWLFGLALFCSFSSALRASISCCCSAQLPRVRRRRVTAQLLAKLRLPVGVQVPIPGS